VTVTLSTITIPIHLTHEELRTRAERSTKARHTRHFLARRDDCEVGFISLDFVPNATYLVLYELFVLAEYRCMGVGTELLRQIENIANEHGYNEVFTNPSPLEPQISAAHLIRWYEKRGYERRPDFPTELRKTLP
jgi:ribosomal protein S18 acetylase RimI-like enzyme